VAGVQRQHMDVVIKAAGKRPLDVAAQHHPESRGQAGLGSVQPQQLF
jgi:hypothetical protein